MRKSVHGPGRGMLAVAAVVVVSACADTVTAPSAATSLDLAEVPSIVEENPFHPNARKYADAGAHPGRGRVGDATLSALALLDAAGDGVVELVAGEWDGWSRRRSMLDGPDGGARLSKVQLKAFDPNGVQQFTTNFNHVAAAATALPASGLLRGGRVKVHANVRHSEFAETEVVAVEAPVLLRPDLAVTALRRPPRAMKNTAIPIVGVVQELNGDLGAWADCVLYVDGVERDRAHGIWVDAGGAVTCVMTHMFRDVGASRIDVRVENVAPRDYDVANNARTGTMNVIFVPSDFFFDAHFEDRTFSTMYSQEWSWATTDGRMGGEGASANESSGRIQDAHLWAFLPQAVTFPLGELFGRQYTAFETAHQALFRQLPPSFTHEDEFGRVSCVSRGYDLPGSGRGWLDLCSMRHSLPDGSEVGYTTVNYSRFAGDVTYASRGQSRYWNHDLGIDDAYAFNYSSRDVVGRFARFGSEYGMFVRIIDGGRTYTVNPFIGLLPFNESSAVPRTCWSWEDPWGSSRSCGESRSEFRGVGGWVSGEPSR